MCRRLLAGGLLAVLVSGAALGLRPAVAAEAERTPPWTALTPAQKQALAPLQREWGSIDNNRKQKWLEVAARFPSLPADERSRIQARMSEWVQMTPAERGRARLQFQETRELGSEQRQARWQAYQSLSDDERRRLTVQSAAPTASDAQLPTRQAPRTPGERARQASAATPAPVSGARPGSPTVVQAKPGATTTTIATRAKPPVHHQPGLPKIAATPGFVDPTTLLPKRGPQGAAVRAPASSDPAQEP